MAKKQENDYLGGFYSDMLLDELKNEIIKNLKRIAILEAERKDYMDSAKDTLKDMDERIRALIHWVGVKETEAEQARMAVLVSKEFSK